MSIDIFSPISIVSVFIIAVFIILKKWPNIPKKLFGGIEVLKESFSSDEVMEFGDDDSLDDVIEASGYSYDSRQDIYYSNMDAWQREFGYCRLYDESAAPLSMIIDCEPIYFEYDNKKWLIEFWKGQYGLTTGCEIGIYNSEGPDVDIPGVFNGTFYNCVSDSELLEMSYILKKNNEKLFARKDKHWWLTGFKLGEFSNPSELTMDIKLTFKDKDMLSAFVEGLKNAGYSDNEIIKKGKKVSLYYSKPHVPQPYTRTKATDWIIQYKNRKICEMYQDITKDCEDMPCKIEAIKNKAPNIYKMIFNVGKNKKLFEKYKKIEDFLD
jgi:Domain of unknown function (DUF4474)